MGLVAEDDGRRMSVPQGLCPDKGYDNPDVYALVEKFGFHGHVRSRGEEARALKGEAGFGARRWEESLTPTPG